MIFAMLIKKLSHFREMIFIKTQIATFLIMILLRMFPQSSPGYFRVKVGGLVCHILRYILYPFTRFFVSKNFYGCHISA